MSKRLWFMTAVAISNLLVGSPAAFAGEQGLLFHLSFDGRITADFAKGEAEGSQKKPEHSVKYVKGVKGKAVLLDNGSIYYEARGNFSAPEGTVMFWANPAGWDPTQPSKKWVSFFDAYQRVGRGGEDKIAFWRYPEYMSGGVYNYHCAQGDNLDSRFFRIKDWEKGQWRFFALTWNEKGLAEFFTNGKLLFRRKRKIEALPVNINHLLIAASGTAYDEFRVFDHPLTEQEILGYYSEADPAILKTRSVSASATYAADGKITFPRGPSTASASPLEGPIKIDGILDEPAWARCVEFQDMSLSTGKKSPTNRTSFRIGYTKEALYMAVVCFSRAGKPKVAVRKHGGRVYTDDSIELFLAPEAGGKEYYQFVANAVAARYEGRAMDGNWNGDWQAAARQEKGKWSLELAIPFDTLGVTPTPGKLLGFNVTRNDRAANQSQTWADLGGYAFHTPSRFGRLLLAKTPVGATGTSMVFRKDGRVAAHARFRNAGETPADVKWLIAGSGDGRGFRFEETLEIDPQTDKMIEKTGSGSGIKGSVGWRSALWVRDGLVYLSPPRTAEFLALPPLVEAREPLTLANEKVRLQFDAYSGAVISLKNLETGLELLPRGVPQPLFSLDAVSIQKHPMFFKEEDVMLLEASNDTARRCRIETRPGGAQVLEAVHAFREGVTVTVTVELPPDSKVSKWKIRVENRLPRRPREGVIVHRVAFPQLGSLQAAESDREQALAWPMQAGRLVAEPARKASRLRKIESPGEASMTWTDLSGPKGGLYLASHDVAPAIQTIFEASGDARNGQVGLTIRRWSLLWPNKDWEPEPCSLGIHSGDWHWSADKYRDWFYKNCPVRPPPQWVRDEDAWLMDGGGSNRATFADIAHALTAAQAMGTNYIQSWQHHMSTEQGELYGGQMPNVYGGTEEEFIKALEDLHRRGGRIGFYFNAGDFESRLGALMALDKYRQKLPDEVVKILPDPNPLADGWLAMGRMEPDGSYKLGWPSGIDMRHGCYGSKRWSDWAFYWVERYANKYKSDAWYQDIAPWSAKGICFHPSHGHDGPIGHGQATIDLGNRIVKAVGPDFGILAEGTCDRLWNYQTHSLLLHGIGEEDSEPGLFIYTHPRFPMFCGTCFYFGRMQKLNKNFFRGSLENPNFADLLRYVLLYGQRFDTFRGPRRSGQEYLSAAQKEERAIILLRKAAHEDLEQSVFKDEIGLRRMPDRVEARVFVHRDAKGALIIVLDFRKEKKAFTLSLDRTPHNLGPPVGAELCLPGGTIKTLGAPAEKRTVISLSLPAESGKISIVRLRFRAQK